MEGFAHESFRGSRLCIFRISLYGGSISESGRGFSITTLGRLTGRFINGAKVGGRSVETRSRDTEVFRAHIRQVPNEGATSNRSFCALHTGTCVIEDRTATRLVASVSTKVGGRISISYDTRGEVYSIYNGSGDHRCYNRITKGDCNNGGYFAILSKVTSTCRFDFITIPTRGRTKIRGSFNKLTRGNSIRGVLSNNNRVALSSNRTRSVGTFLSGVDSSTRLNERCEGDVVNRLIHLYNGTLPGVSGSTFRDITRIVATGRLFTFGGTFRNYTTRGSGPTPRLTETRATGHTSVKGFGV